jgi:hypothetical protein
MLGLSRGLLTFLIAVPSQFVGLPWPEPATNRPFFVKWAKSANNETLLSVHFADVRTGGRSASAGRSWRPATAGPPGSRGAPVTTFPTKVRRTGDLFLNDDATERRASG